MFFTAATPRARVFFTVARVFFTVATRARVFFTVATPRVRVFFTVARVFFTVATIRHSNCLTRVHMLSMWREATICWIMTERHEKGGHSFKTQF